MSIGVCTDEALYAQWFDADSIAARQGAWEELETRYRTRLLAYCNRICGDPTRAEEYVADAFFALMHYRRTIGKSFRAYLWTTACNLTRHTRRSSHGPPDREDPAVSGHRDGATAAASPASGPPAVLIAAEERAALEHCLGRFKPDEREFVQVHVCDELTLREAGALAGGT